MMDLAQQPTNADTRNFPRKVHNPPLREKRVVGALPTKTSPDEKSVDPALGAALEKLRFAEQKLREQTREIKRSRKTIDRERARRSKAESDLRELNRDLEARIASRTVQLGDATRAKDAVLFTERKARAEAEEANRVKADFLAILSHEFRTPLQAIFGYTELLERQIHGPLNDSQLRDIERIQQSQQHLLGLITTVLDFARLESAKDIQLDLGATVVDEILCQIEGFVGSQLESRGLGYNYHSSDKRIAALADPAKLQQIVLKLLANAIKFTPRDGHISLECVQDSPWVVIKVTDTGIGIPADKLETVFQPFVQIRARDSRSEGTGLGLAISRKLATAMGGTLTATSVDGRGSTFTLTLPSMNADARVHVRNTPRASRRSRA